jgi:Zn-dependent M28 family amino/carboxypeptidase
MKRRVGSIVVALALFAGLAAASTIDEIVGHVSAGSYQGYLDNQLYAHDGDNRGFGADHDPARTNIYNDFLSFGLTTSLYPFTYSSGTYYDVVGVLPGADPSAGTYILGAHYDSVSNPGADDNASGVAGVLEAARVLSPYSFASTLIFIAFDREEQGLYGSHAYADAHAGDKIKGMVSLDMISYNAASPHDTASIQARTASLPIQTDLKSAVETYGGLSAVLSSAEDCCSDQFYFEQHGFQAALLIEGGWASNSNYHSSRDSLDTPNYIDYTFATAMTRSAVGWMADQAEPVPEPATGLCIVTAVWVIFYSVRRRGPSA